MVDVPDKPTDMPLVTCMNALSTLHSSAAVSNDPLSRYRVPLFRGTLKPREGDQRFGRLKLDATTAFELGTSNIGLFVECCPSFERMLEHFRSLQDDQSGAWVIVASSKQVKEELIRLAELEHSLPPNVTVATPEELPRLGDSIECPAGIFIFDYACHIHKCRGNSFRRFKSANDRPQKIADFRMKFRIRDWSPPLFLLTNRKALAVNTIPMLSPYCLEAFRYIDGQTMRFGKIAQERTTP